MNNELKDHIVAFLDILGFKKLQENEHDFRNLLSVIKNLRRQNTNGNIIYKNTGGSHSMTAMPAITSFSDSIVLSVPLEAIKPPFNIGSAVHALLGFIQQLTDSLMIGGYILRGGIARGKLYHEDGVVMGAAYHEALKLESDAKSPRILVSDELAEEYNHSKHDANNFLFNDNTNGIDEYCLDYLKASFYYLENEEKCIENRRKYIEKTKTTIRSLNESILENLSKGNLNQLDEATKILRKWIYLQNYITRTLYSVGDDVQLLKL